MKTLYKQTWTYVAIIVIAFVVIEGVAYCKRHKQEARISRIVRQYDNPDDPLMCQKIFSQQVEGISNDLTIWMGVIGAMCTILVVVLGFRQSMDSQHMLEEFRKENSKVIADTKAALESQRKQNEKKLNNQIYVNSIACVNNVLQSITQLCDLRDIKFKGDVRIANSPIIGSMLSSLSYSAEQALEQYCSIRNTCEDDDQKRIIFHSAIAALQALKNLAQCYEDVVGVMSMVQLQSIKDWISIQVLKYSEDVEKKAVDPVDPLYDVKVAAQKVEAIIKAEMRSQNENN